MTAPTLQPGQPNPADPAGEETRLECRGVTVRFGGLVAVKNADLAVPPATIVGLIGPNGAGKSTLFAVLSGLLRPTSGQVYQNGQDVTGTRPQIRAERGLARTFQHPELFPGLTVREHLTLGYRVRHNRGRIWTDLITMGSVRPVETDEKTRVEQLLDLLGLNPVADRPALGLPLGQARLVELGRALSTSPTVLLLDEPSSGLDSTETEQLETTLRRVTTEQGISVLLVEHDVELVMRLCAHIYVLDFGSLIADGNPQQIQADPAVRAAYLGEEVPADTPTHPHPTTGSSSVGDRDSASPIGSPSGNGSGEDDDDPDRDGHAGPVITTHTPTPTDQPAAQAAALNITDLSVRYGDAIAVTNLSFTIAPGQTLAVLGANGAGKSSLARAISGLVPTHHGTINYNGQNIQNWAPYRIRRAGLIHLPEGRGVFRELNVIDNLRMAVNTLPRQDRQTALDQAFTTFPILANRRRQLARLLSGGEQQMLSLARALATQPNLLIADEMSLGLAPKLVDAVFDGLQQARQTGITIMMIEQYIHRALAFADHCLVLQRGQQAWQGPTSAAQTELLRHYLGEGMTVTT
jgi:branched-chain amino acid transport system ATP-binding protein